MTTGVLSRGIDYGRPVAYVVTALLLVVAAAVAVIRWQAFVAADAVAIDYQTFVVFGQRFLDTGSMYLPAQVAGPFDSQPLPHVPAVMPSMYPPTAAYGFAALTVLPAFAWWAVPTAVLGCALYRWRPAYWSWPVLALLLCFPVWASTWAVGGSAMWITAGVAAGLLWGWPAVLIVGKPMYAPLTLIGVRRRSWWLAAAVLALVSLPLIPEWIDYVAVVRNADLGGYGGLSEVPLLAWPVVAWLARDRAAELDRERGD